MRQYHKEDGQGFGHGKGSIFHCFSTLFLQKWSQQFKQMSLKALSGRKLLVALVRKEVAMLAHVVVEALVELRRYMRVNNEQVTLIVAESAAAVEIGGTHVRKPAVDGHYLTVVETALIIEYLRSTRREDAGILLNDTRHYGHIHFSDTITCTLTPRRNARLSARLTDRYMVK